MAGSHASGVGSLLEPCRSPQHHSSNQEYHPSGSSAHSRVQSPARGQTDAESPPSSSSRNTYSSASTRLSGQPGQSHVRTLPPWLDSFEEGDDLPASGKPLDQPISPPSQTHSAQHHFAHTQPERRVSQDGFVDTSDDILTSIPEKRQDTGFFGGHREPERGRKWDHVRQGDPVILQSGVLPSRSPWRTFIKSTMYGPGLFEEGTRVDEELLERQAPGYDKPWRGDNEDNDDLEKSAGLLHGKKRRKTLIKRLQYNLLMHPLVPLVFRLIVLTTSTIALGLSGSVYHLSNKYHYSQNPSTTMAIVVDVVAMPYILYVTWDEYTGKPLGLRSPKTKIRLVLLDVFFIIFESANLALAFGALTDDNGSCRSVNNGFNYIICDRVKALCGILMLALIAWGLTFSVSIFRLVERVGGREEAD